MLTKGLTRMRRLAMAAALGVTLAAAPSFAQQAPAAPAPAAPAVQVPLQTPAAPAPFPAGAKIGILNLQRLTSESAEGKVATGQVNSLVQKKQAESNERTKVLQAAQQKLEAGGNVMSEAARAQLTKEVERQQIDLQRFTEDAQQEVQTFQQTLLLDFQQKLGPVVEALAKERDLHMIFSVDSAGLVWANAALDLTSEVIQRFDAATAQARPAAPAAARPAAPAAPVPAPGPATAR